MPDLPIQAIHIGDEVAVSRTDGTGPVLIVSLDAWREFLAGIRLGDFELPAK